MCHTFPRDYVYLPSCIYSWASSVTSTDSYSLNISSLIKPFFEFAVIRFMSPDIHTSSLNDAGAEKPNYKYNPRFNSRMPAIYPQLLICVDT